MDDAALVAIVAAEMVVIAAGLGDDFSLNAWTDIAGAVATLVGRDAIMMLARGQDRGRRLRALPSTANGKG